MEQATQIPTNDSQNPSTEIVTHHNGGRGWSPGRKHGATNKLTRERKAFLEGVFGAPDTPERREMEAAIRKQFLDGTIAPAIGLVLIHHWLGKPKETLDVNHSISRTVREIVDPTPPDATDITVIEERQS